MKLKSIKAEAAACRQAFKDVKPYSLAIHCHHEVLFEFLTEPAENRIAYILEVKPKHERALRLRLFRPITKKMLVKFPKLAKTHAEWNKAHAELDKACAEWDKACAEWNKACAELAKACAELAKACAELDKACAELDKAKLHTAFCREKNCPWNGITIFPKEKSNA